MEYKLVPASDDMPTLSVTVPKDVVVVSSNASSSKYDKLVRQLALKNCIESETGEFQCNGKVIKGTDFRSILLFLAGQKVKKPGKVKRVAKSLFRLGVPQKSFDKSVLYKLGF